jgi:hypothetical protein
MISVSTPAACARAAIAEALPPSDLLTYQIHIDLPRIGAIHALALAGASHSTAPSTTTISSAASAAFALRQSRKRFLLASPRLGPPYPVATAASRLAAFEGVSIAAGPADRAGLALAGLAGLA